MVLGRIRPRKRRHSHTYLRAAACLSAVWSRVRPCLWRPARCCACFAGQRVTPARLVWLGPAPLRAPCSTSSDAEAPRVLDPALYAGGRGGRALRRLVGGLDLADGAGGRWSPPWTLAGRERLACRGHRRRLQRAAGAGAGPRDRGPTAAAAVCGVQALAHKVEFAGVIVVGGDERAAAAELRRDHRVRRSVPVPGLDTPPQLTEQFLAAVRLDPPGLHQIDPRPVRRARPAVPGERARTCRRRRADARPRGAVTCRPLAALLAPRRPAAGLRVAVAWGAPAAAVRPGNLNV